MSGRSNVNALMCVSGITSRAGEQCLVSSSSAGVHLEPCFEAIAAGDGREIMQFDSVHVPLFTSARVAQAHIGSATWAACVCVCGLAGRANRECQ